MYSFLITIFFLPQIFQVILLLLRHIFSAPSALEPATTLSTFPEMKPAAALLWACRAPRAQCLVYTHLMLWDRPLPWLGSVSGPGSGVLVISPHWVCKGCCGLQEVCPPTTLASPGPPTLTEGYWIHFSPTAVGLLPQTCPRQILQGQPLMFLGAQPAGASPAQLV